MISVVVNRVSPIVFTILILCIFLTSTPTKLNLCSAGFGNIVILFTAAENSLIPRALITRIYCICVAELPEIGWVYVHVIIWIPSPAISGSKTLVPKITPGPEKTHPVWLTNLSKLMGSASVYKGYGTLLNISSGTGYIVKFTACDVPIHPQLSVNL